jgi:endonuclease/exonuclease/phosphatase (EEP) superfamily protein YafD
MGPRETRPRARRGARGGGLAGLVATVVLAGRILAGCDTPGPRARPTPAELTLATFNVYFPAADDAETVAAVGETQADVILLQEISPRWQSVLEQHYAGAYPYRLFAPGAGAGGLGVLSRFPLRDRGVLRPRLKHPAWLVAVSTPVGELNLLNVHLRASARPGQDPVSGLFGLSSDHALEMRGFMDACGVEPDVVAGDFNEADGGAVAWLEQRGFVDALRRHHAGEPTWRTLGGLLADTLDHVLSNRTLVAVDAWVLRRGSSDHWPLIVRLRRAGVSGPRAPAPARGD